MMSRPKPPVYLLIVVCLIFLLLSFFKKGTIDFHWADTYYVVSPEFVYGPCASFLFLLTAVYYFASGLLRDKLLTWVHVLFTIAGILLFLRLLLWNSLNHLPQKYLDYETLPVYLTRNDLIRPVMIFSAAQVCLLLNFIAGLGVWKKSGR